MKEISDREAAIFWWHFISSSIWQIWKILCTNLIFRVVRFLFYFFWSPTLISILISTQRQRFAFRRWKEEIPRH